MLMALTVTRLLPAEQAFAGFGSDAVIMIFGLLVLTAALLRTGVVENTGRMIIHRVGERPVALLVVIMVLSATLGAFMSNTASTAFFVPIVIGIARKARISASRFLLWKGHCSVHGRFSAANVAQVRERVPGVTVLVHPECTHEVVTAADLVGSTEYIIRALDAAPAGSAWAIGTELNLVRRLAKAHPDKQVHYLDSTVCFCSTMNRIDLPHLVWALESLVDGRVPNRVVVDADDAHWARVALDQMLALPGV